MFNPGSPTVMFTILFLVAFQGLFRPLYLTAFGEFKSSILNSDGVFPPLAFSCQLHALALGLAY